MKLAAKPLKSRRCKAKSCKVMFPPLRPLQVACSPLCALSMVSERKEKEEALRLKRERQEYRERKAEIRPLQYWLKRTEKIFNQWIRTRDHEQPCISCGTYDSPSYHAGHFVSVGASSALRFDESNVHLQCTKCNVFLAGNLTHYEARLIAKLGVETVERLKTAPRSKTWTRDELRAIEADAKLKLRDLQKEAVCP